MTEPPRGPRPRSRLCSGRTARGRCCRPWRVRSAPDAEVRAWLVRSWLAPGRPIDGALLSELSARGGRQARAGAPVPGLAAGRVDGLGPPALPAGRAARGGGVAAMIRVTLEGLVKRYAHVAVVDGASLEIRPGELAYLLGPPGPARRPSRGSSPGSKRSTTARSSSTSG